MARLLRRTGALRDEIKEILVQRISIDGTYGPGQRIKESVVAAEFGVSQAPVREALRELEAMRFVESQPHKGARVRAMSTDELIQIYPVRAALEELAGREAAARMNPEVLGALADELADMRVAAANNDIHAQLVHDARFHEIIVEASGNQVLLDLWRSLRVEARTLVSVLRGHSDLHAIAELHRPVLLALEFGDPDLAGKELRAHIEYFGTSVANRVNSTPG